MELLGPFVAFLVFVAIYEILRRRERRRVQRGWLTLIVGLAARSSSRTSTTKLTDRLAARPAGRSRSGTSGCRRGELIRLVVIRGRARR
jgi:hypothetical protein